MKTREFHPPHIYEYNACYFLTGSIVHRQWLLDTDSKRILVQEVLKEAIERYGIRLYAWVILADHYHLLLKTSDVAPIYKFIKRLHGDSAIQRVRLIAFRSPELVRGGYTIPPTSWGVRVLASGFD